MTPNDAALDSLLGPGSRRPMWRRPSWWITLAGVAALAVGFALWTGRQREAAVPVYDTQAVNRGTLEVRVTANGTLQPTTQVAIGSELSGTVARVAVDINDRVRKGQLLIQLDDARLRDQVASARAAVAAAQAGSLQARATAREARDTLARLRDVRERSAGQVPSAAEMAAAEAALARAEAAEASAEASIAQARATSSSAETNLAKASIRSPIDGVVLSRQVEPGNAVAASLQAVTLLTLAQDLTQMKLQVYVDEADVGQVQAGQAAKFTVSSYPQRAFPARITRVGFGSTVKDNVVTYGAELSVDNADSSLRPGMSATATIETLVRRDVLLVPNAALRYAPAAASASASAPSGGSTILSTMMPRPPGGGTGSARRAGTNASQARQVWVLDQGQPRAVPVTPGPTDGRMTEVTSTELTPGMAVIVAQRGGAKR